MEFLDVLVLLITVQFFIVWKQESFSMKFLGDEISIVSRLDVAKSAAIYYTLYLSN